MELEKLRSPNTFLGTYTLLTYECTYHTLFMARYLTESYGASSGIIEQRIVEGECAVW